MSATGVELLDDRFAAAPMVRESLGNIARANRWLGGAAAIRFGLRSALPAREPGPFTILDVGTGAGDLPRMATAWARRRGITLCPVGIEYNRNAAGLARENGLASIVADGGVLPLRNRSVDYVLLSQVAHHFSPDATIHLFRECGRVARRAIIVSDLRNSALARWTYPLAGWTLRFDRDTIRDGVTSLRRGFTTTSLSDLLSRADLPARVVRRPGARLVAIAPARRQ